MILISFFDHLNVFLQGKAKWDAWNGKKGMSQDEAKQKYVDLANQLKEKHGLSG